MANSILRKFTFLTSLGIVLPAFLTGCAPSFDGDLVATCDGIRTNLDDLRDYPSELADYDSAPEGYMATNIGNSKRVEFALLVNELYPWIPTFADHSLDPDYYAGIEAGIWQRATAGTPVEYAFSATDQSEYLVEGGKNLEDILGFSIESVVGDGLDSDIGCDEYDKKRREELGSSDYDDSAYMAWYNSVSRVTAIAGQYREVSECLDTGSYRGSKCASEDYVSTWDWSDYEIEPTNPWQREWSSDWLEAIAKTAWCIENGYRDYRAARDACVN